MRRDDPEPHLGVKSDSLRRRCRGFLRGIVVDSSSADSKIDVDRPILPRLEGTADPVPNVEDKACVGVVAPEEKADNPVLAGVEGGGRGPEDVSEVDENGLGKSDSL